MDPIFNDPRLRWIAQEWSEESDRLASWGLESLVNRFDVWGQYTLRSDSLGTTVGAVTLPVEDLRGGGDMVSFDKLKRHFTGRKPSDLIGLHCVSGDETCRWFAVDLDVHDEKDASYLQRANLDAMRIWSAELQKDLLDPLILDSNGMGSYHLLVLLDRPYPLTDVFAYLTKLCENHHELDLGQKPELFPSSGKLKRLGKWLRLPGRHHTRNHFTKVWTDDFGGRWLEGVEAIGHLISSAKMPLPRLTAEKTRQVKTVNAGNTRIRTICVDLDNVLASYDGWRGVDRIGPPIVGAKEFLRKLRRKYRVVIYTSRLSNERVRSSGDVQTVKNLIEKWLRRHGMEFDEVFTGVGKPLASAFVDDRAVSCRPAEDGEAFAKALRKIKRL